MTINLIVVSVTLMIGGFVVLWLACPRCRPWIEAPKWQPLAWERPAECDPSSEPHDGAS